MNTTERIRTFIAETFFFGDGHNLDDSASLLSAGVIDSTGVMELIMFLEETFEITIADEELIPENLESIDRIARFVDRKLTAGASQPDVVRS